MLINVMTIREELMIIECAWSFLGGKVVLLAHMNIASSLQAR